MAFGGKDELLKHSNLLVEGLKGLPEPAWPVTLAALVDMDAKSEVESIVSSSKSGVRRLCEKAYMISYPWITILLGIQGLEPSHGSIGVCPSTGSLEDYLLHILPSMPGTSFNAEKLAKLCELVTGEGLAACHNPKHVYALLRLQTCKGADHEVVKELESDPVKAAERLQELDPCITRLLGRLLHVNPVSRPSPPS